MSLSPRVMVASELYMYSGLQRFCTNRVWVGTEARIKLEVMASVKVSLAPVKVRVTVRVKVMASVRVRVRVRVEVSVRVRVRIRGSVEEAVLRLTITITGEYSSGWVRVQDGLESYDFTLHFL